MIKLFLNKKSPAKAWKFKLVIFREKISKFSENHFSEIFVTSMLYRLKLLLCNLPFPCCTSLTQYVWEVGFVLWRLLASSFACTLKLLSPTHWYFYNLSFEIVFLFLWRRLFILSLVRVCTFYIWVVYLMIHSVKD